MTEAPPILSHGLMLIDDDVFVAERVVAVTVDECMVQVYLRDYEEPWEYEYDTETEAVASVRKCVAQLSSSRIVV